MLVPWGRVAVMDFCAEPWQACGMSDAPAWIWPLWQNPRAALIWRGWLMEYQLQSAGPPVLFQKTIQA